MFSANRSFFASVATLAVLSWGSAASAEELAGASPEPALVATFLTTCVSECDQSQQVTPAEPAIVVARNPLGSKPPLSIGALAARRGGDRVFNDSQLKGVVAENSASYVTTGNNAISDNAFAGTTGIPMVIQNSGNNVLIQNSTIVNIQMK